MKPEAQYETPRFLGTLNLRQRPNLEGNEDEWFLTITISRLPGQALDWTSPSVELLQHFKALDGPVPNKHWGDKMDGSWQT